MGEGWKVFYNHIDAPYRNYFYVRKYRKLFYFTSAMLDEKETIKEFETRIARKYLRYSKDRKSLVEDAFHKMRQRKPFDPKKPDFARQIKLNTLFYNAVAMQNEEIITKDKKRVDKHLWFSYMQEKIDYYEIYQTYRKLLEQEWHRNSAEMFGKH